jgi:transcription initiation factor TFIIIB Brf1 subunit/transcription initiation factor TFIIB
MPTVGCPHHRTQLIAQDSEAHYVECLDCGAILEASEIDRPREAEPDKGTGFDESLSDA